MENYNLKVDLGEYHLIFRSLFDQRLRNEKTMEEMYVKENPEAIFATVVSNQQEYDRLAKENEKISTLMDKIYDQTGEQLKEKTPAK